MSTFGSEAFPGGNEGFDALSHLGSSEQVGELKETDASALVPSIEDAEPQLLDAYGPDGEGYEFVN